MAGLLVTPAIAVLFVMNIFPLLWSLGLSFFAYQSNQQSIRFVGLNNYIKVLTNDIAAGSQLECPGQYRDVRGR
jgi:multiple sugar transport system permease protein